MTGTEDVSALLAQIAGIGRDPVRGGWSRHAFDAADAELRAWFRARAEDLGLHVEVDRNANLWAWWGEPGAGAVGTGSHLDSVPGGGEFDGPLGVASALAAVARLQRSGFTPARPLAVVVFTEEEGSRFGLACLGSRLLTGVEDPDRIRALTDRAGGTFAAAARDAGVDPGGIGADPARLALLEAFVELHVEQGRGLADLDRPVAVASGILAHGRWRLDVVGAGNHAGTTAMTDRRDPTVAAARTVLAVRELATSSGQRGTVGRLELVPGGTNVIASRATVWLDARAEDDPALAALVQEVVATASALVQEEGCRLTVTEESVSPLVTFDPALRDRLVAVLGGAPVLPTGAGHDAGVLAPFLPTAMLFVRNPDGVSHAPGEGASPTDCAAGVDALTAVLQDLLR